MKRPGFSSARRKRRNTGFPATAPLLFYTTKLKLPTDRDKTAAISHRGIVKQEKSKAGKYRNYL